MRRLLILSTVFSLAFVATLAAGVALAGPAGAQDAAATVETGSGDLITLDALVVTVLASTVIPIVTGLAVKAEAAKGWFSFVSLALSAVVGTLTQIVADGGTFHVGTAVLLTVTAFTTQLTAYLGVWKPATGSTPGAGATSGFGLG